MHVQVQVFLSVVKFWLSLLYFLVIFGIKVFRNGSKLVLSDSYFRNQKMASKRRKGIIFKIGEEMSAKGLKDDHPPPTRKSSTNPTQGTWLWSLLRGEVTPNVNTPVMMILLVFSPWINFFSKCVQTFFLGSMWPQRFSASQPSRRFCWNHSGRTYGRTFGQTDRPSRKES